MTRLIKMIKKWYNDDPLYNCKVYLNEGCENIDSNVCDLETCEILKEYEDINDKVKSYNVSKR